MRQSRNFLLLGFAASLLFVRCSCDFGNAIGSLLISEKDEERLGASFHQTLKDSGRGEYDFFIPKNQQDSLFVGYVRSVFNSVLNSVPSDEMPDYNFTFTILDENVENAFAVPGGYVYFYTGIIKTMQDESEMAGVMGHEIAHITKHHYRDALAKQAGLSIVLDALFDDDAGALAKAMAGTFQSMVGLKVSRGNESEADEYGTRYLGASSRYPLGIASYFGRMQTTSPFSTLFSSHPAPSNRVEEVTKQVNKNPELSALKDDSLRFKEKFVDNTQVLKKTIAKNSADFLRLTAAVRN